MDEKNARFQPGLKLGRHKELGDYLDGKPVYPIGVEFSPSGKCSAKCPKCWYRQPFIKGWSKEFFKESRMEGLVEEFAGLGLKSVTWTGGGEPTEHPSYPKFVNLVNWAGLEQGLFTNALKPIQYDPSILEWIRVTKTNYDFNEENIKNLRACKTVGICINYKGEMDDKDIKDALNIAEKLHSSRESPEQTTYVQVRPALEAAGKKIYVKMPNIKHPLLILTDYKFLGSNSERGYEDCEAYHFVPWIWQNGDVDVCSHHWKEPNFHLGNLYTEGKEGRFREIMKNAPKSVEVAKDCQVCCKLNSMNSMIKIMRELKDINFP